MERTGLVAFWKDYDRKLYLRAAELADDLGYESFWLPEAWGYDIVPLLTEMALRTKRIKLGTSILNVFSRSAGSIAMTAATVDEISEGRFILGLGTSGRRVIEGFHGRAFDKPLTRLQDTIKVVRTLLAGGSLHEAGATLDDLRPFKLAMTPHRRHVPIYVAALKQRSIEGIGELADGWIPTFWPYDRLDDGRAWIAEGARRAGRDPSTIDVAPITTAIPLGGGSTDMARDIIALYVGGMGDYYHELLSGFGYRAECDRIAELWKDRSTRAQARAAVTDAIIRVLTVTGTPEQCLDALTRLRSNGLDLPLLSLPTGMPWPMVEMFVRAMAPRAR